VQVHVIILFIAVFAESLAYQCAKVNGTSLKIDNLYMFFSVAMKK